jgi:hypothetical protein
VREETGGVLWFSDAASDEDARGERVQADLDGKTAGGATLGLDVSLSTRKNPAQPATPLVQTSAVSNVRTEVV